MKIYIAGKIDLKNMNETRKRFAEAQKALEALGFEVYNPATYELGNGFERKELAERDFSALEEADMLLVYTDEMSLGTTIELGYFLCKKRHNNGRIIIVYTGNQKYKFTTMYDFIKNYSPMTYYVDYVTNNLNDATDYIKQKYKS